jgi:hypothetical protein
MPEVGHIRYSLKELTALMVRDQGIRNGLWMIWTRWGHSVTNIYPPKDVAEQPAGPGVVSVLVEAGIQKADEPGPLTIDASELWGEEVEEKKTEEKARRSR